MPIAFAFFGASFTVLFASYLLLGKAMDITTILLFLSGANFFGIGLIAELMVRLSRRRGDK